MTNILSEVLDFLFNFFTRACHVDRIIFVVDDSRASLGMDGRGRPSPRELCHPLPASRYRDGLHEVIHLQRALRPLPRALELLLDKPSVVIASLRFQGFA